MLGLLANTKKFGMSALQIGGTIVPNAAQYPSATPVPSDSPR